MLCKDKFLRQCNCASSIDSLTCVTDITKMYNNASSIDFLTCKKYWKLHTCIEFLSYHLQSTNVLPQYHSRPESLFTDIARQRDSLQMVCFNVVSDGYSCTFFSTHFANFSFPSSTWNKVRTCLHH